MEKLEQLWDYIYRYKFLILILLLTLLAYFFTKHDEPISFMDSVNIIIALIVGYIAIKADQLSSTDEIRASYISSTSIYHQWHICEILLENKRNKPIVINAIHLSIGNNYVVKLKEYDEPFVLKPLEAVKIKLEPVSYYIAGSNKLINLEKELKKCKRKCLIITSTDRFIKVKYFKHCPNFIYKMLTEPGFAEICPHRVYWDDKKDFVVDYNAKFLVRIKEKEDSKRCIDMFYVNYDNTMSSRLTDVCRLADVATENTETLKNKLIEILPEKYKQSFIEIKQDNIFCNLLVKKFELPHYNWFITKISTMIYKFKENKKRKKLKTEKAKK